MEIRVVAKVIVVNDEGKILLLKRSATDARRPLQWDIPGGHTDEQELAEEAAVRETKEESDIELHARNLRLVYAMSEVVQEGLNVTWLFYLAHTQHAEVVLSKEHNEYAWETLDKVIEKVDYNRQKVAFRYIRDNKLLA